MKYYTTIILFALLITPIPATLGMIGSPRNRISGKMPPIVETMRLEVKSYPDNPTLDSKKFDKIILEGHELPVTAWAYIPKKQQVINGSTKCITPAQIVTTSLDQTVRFWDQETGKSLNQLKIKNYGSALEHDSNTNITFLGQYNGYITLFKDSEKFGKKLNTNQFCSLKASRVLEVWQTTEGRVEVFSTNKITKLVLDNETKKMTISSNNKPDCNWDLSKEKILAKRNEPGTDNNSNNLAPIILPQNDFSVHVFTKKILDL